MVAVFSLLVVCAQDNRESVLIMMCWLGVATAIAGVLTHTGVLPLSSGLEEGRLQFTFQYANAAGVWYGSMVLLCVLSPEKRLQSFTALPALALLLTQSGGAILAFLAVAIVVGAYVVSNRDLGLLSDALVQALVALVSFAFCVWRPGIGDALGLVLALSCCVLLTRRDVFAHSRFAGSKGSWALLACLLVAAVVGLSLTSARLGFATSNFVERLYHIRDGISLWSGLPVFGIGPGNWQYAYRMAQSAQYNATIVHCAYVQVLLDAGIVGLLPLFAAIAIGARGLMSDPEGDEGWARAELAALLLLALHALVDFDLCFTSLGCLLALLVCGPTGPTMQLGRWRLALTPALLVSCMLGLLCAASTFSLSMANARGDYASCIRLYESSPLAKADQSARGEYLMALRSTGRHSEVVEAYRQMPDPTDRCVILAALSLADMGEINEAGIDLVHRLEERPFDIPLFDAATEVLTGLGASQEVADAYGEFVEHADGLIAQTSELLPLWRLY
ncbi:MAG: O-antigen ligase family protein [Atopobiaceae bacterium]|nr:O-antigen ligase family protein [Atopobiaceae bacterium]